MPSINTLQKSGLALAISHLICHGASAAELTITTSADSLDTNTGSECTLRKAIESVNEGIIKPGCVNSGMPFGSDDRIVVDPSLTEQTIVLAGQQLSVGSQSGDPLNLTIEGNGITIDGDEKSRVMQLQQNNSLTMSSVTITRGSTRNNNDDNSNGAGIELKAGSTLSLSDSTLSNNTARRRGGAISARSLSDEAKSSASLRNTDVIQNVSLLNDGAGLHFSGADLTMTDSVLSDNTARGSTATGAGAYLTDAQFKFERVSINGNQAGTTNNRFSAAGGLSFSGGNGTQMMISASTVSSNTAFGSGGGIRVRAYSGALVEITNTTISGNSAVEKQSTNGGGVLFAGDGLVTIRNSTIVDNIARDESGSLKSGGLFLQALGTNVVLQNTILATPNSSPACEINSGVVSANQDSLIFGSGCNTSAISADPRLQSLAQNGGPTLTHLPLSDSPAINRGSNDSCVAEDQRGEERVRSNRDRCDIGAVETKLKGGVDTVFFVIPSRDGNTVVFEL